MSVILHPTLYELERAILLYTSPAQKSGLKEWQAMKWVWECLSWSARFVTHFGTSGSSWWKERYVFPVLCQEAIPFLQRFLCGNWTRGEEESLRHAFHFFAPHAVKHPSLFPEAVSCFLSRACPSFNTEREMAQARLSGKGGAKNCSWLRDETFARYQARMQLLPKRQPSTVAPEKEEIPALEPHELVDAVKEEAKEKAKKRFDEMTATQEEIARLSDSLDQEVRKAFPIRYEAEMSFAELTHLNEEVVSFLVLVDGALARFSDGIAACLSDVQARRLIHDAEKALKGFRNDVSAFRTQADRIIAGIEEIRKALNVRLQSLTRVLDRVPMLESTNLFRVHQARLVKSGREKLKRFRLALTSGPGPEMMFSELDRQVGGIVELAKAFYDEGEEISSMRERLHHFEHQIQQMLKQTLPSSRASSLRDLLGEVIGLKRTLEIASDRKGHFEHIVRSLCTIPEG